MRVFLLGEGHSQEKGPGKHRQESWLDRIWFDRAMYREASPKAGDEGSCVRPYTTNKQFLAAGGQQRGLAEVLTEARGANGSPHEEPRRLTFHHKHL